MPFVYVNTNAIVDVITNVKILPRVPFTYVRTNVIANINTNEIATLIITAISNINTNTIADEQSAYRHIRDSHKPSINEPGLRTYKNQR